MRTRPAESLGPAKSRGSIISKAFPIAFAARRTSGTKNSPSAIISPTLFIPGINCSDNIFCGSTFCSNASFTISTTLFRFPSIRALLKGPKFSIILFLPLTIIIYLKSKPVYLPCKGYVPYLWVASTQALKFLSGVAGNT